ncbi:fungal-specific transcription factor domain-containing protein [Peziza echinospora]|nr:fungal-specific transcription factor domain-containing protein [Peziza echinospora]
MLSPIARCTSSQPRRKVDTVITNMGLIVDEIVKKREAWDRAPGAKRKSPDNIEDLCSISPDPILPVNRQDGEVRSPTSDSYAKLQEYIAGQLRRLPPPPLITVSESSLLPFAESPETLIFTPGPLSSPAAFSNCPTPLMDNNFFKFDADTFGDSFGWPTPKSPLNTIVLSPPQSPILDSLTNQDLFKYYLEVPAQRLADTSPSYIDLFGNYIPAMAQNEPALMEALLGLAALQMGLSIKDLGLSRSMSVRAINHYQIALRIHYESLRNPHALTTDVPLATSIILSHFELWNGELIKMGVHMNGCRDIIHARGKAAHMTPVGRALLAAFRRLDVSSSAISGNPSFQTEDWWTVDPLTRIPISHDSPPLLAADAAFSKLCVICSKLCHLKAWIIRRRREVHQATLEVEEGVRSAKKAALEQKIEQKITSLENDVEAWRKELPPCFNSLHMPLLEDGVSQAEVVEDIVDEDINSTENHEIVPKLYAHKAIALVVAYGIGADIQLYRLRHPDLPVVCPEIGSKCHSLLRVFSGLPSSCDGAMTAPLFATAIELRQKPHQEWLVGILAARISETGFYAMRFLSDGVQYAYSKLDGMRKAPYIRIKEGAAARIDGVSENLWSAEGMMRSMEALSLYEDAAGTRGRKVYRGDFMEGDYYAECDGPEEVGNEEEEGGDGIEVEAEAGLGVEVEEGMDDMWNISSGGFQ